MKKPTKQVKRILYVFRVLMTGINLMRTGVVESNILRFNADLKLSYVPELFAQKVRGYEKRRTGRRSHVGLLLEGVCATPGTTSGRARREPVPARSRSTDSRCSVFSITYVIQRARNGER